MIIGIYMCVPLIKAIVLNNDHIIYYLVLWFVFASLIPEIVMLIGDFANKSIINVVDIINSDIKNMGMYLVLGYIGYFILGYYLDNISLRKKQRIVIYILGAMGCVFTVGMDAVVALNTNKPCGNYYGFFNANVLFPAIAVFVWFKNRKFNNNNINRVFRRLSKYCFGAYLIHALIIEQLNIRFNINTLTLNPIISIPCICIIVFALSIGVSALLNHVPIVKHYVV